VTTLLLPPSETKREGGVAGSTLDLATLSHPALGDARHVALAALQDLMGDATGAARGLKLSARAAEREIARNRSVLTSATLPAVERYTGVLFDALDTDTLGDPARARARDHVLIHSALFGLIGAGDLIPAYRLSHDSRLPGLRLAHHWAGPNSRVLEEVSGPILDLRSEGYAALGPLPARPDALYVRVVSVGPDGVARALNHFNKKGKGQFVRALLEQGELPDSVEGLIAISNQLGWPLRPGAPGELELVVPGTLTS
jgi:uncharacterized protein